MPTLTFQESKNVIESRLQFNTKTQHAVIAAFFILVTLISVAAVQQLCEFSVATTLSLMLSASAFICVLSIREYYELNAPAALETQDVILKNMTAFAWYNHCERMHYTLVAHDLNCVVAMYNGEPVGMLNETENWLMFGEGHVHN